MIGGDVTAAVSGSAARPDACRTNRGCRGLLDLPDDCPQVELVAQALAEPVDHGRGVVSALVELAIHGGLHASPDGLEQGECDQCRGSHRDRVRLRDPRPCRLQRDEARREDRPKDPGDGGPTERAADDPVDR